METKPKIENYIVAILPAILTIFIIFFLIMPKVKENREVKPVVEPQITNFYACLEAGYPIMESYPRQCRVPSGEVFSEEIGNEFEKADMIRLSQPRPNQEIESPLLVSGEARGSWFFEGSFPVVLTDWDGLIIATGIAQAEGDWMSEEFVRFKAELVFEKPEYKNNGNLILRKDNPSGLPEFDDALEIPIFFK